MRYSVNTPEAPKSAMLRVFGAMGVAVGRCWCLPHRALNPIWNAVFYFGIAALTAVTVFRVLVLVENFLQSPIFAV